jgi:hypothetical protein
VTDRPLFARVAVANIGSLHVLAKCGFETVAEHARTTSGSARCASPLPLELAPPSRPLLAMICSNIACSAEALSVSPS